MQLATAGVALVALALPYTPLARLLGFVPLPALFLLAVAAIVVVYFAAAELTKRWFFRRFES
jgi:Mg2+-importing ATPase